MLPMGITTNFASHLCIQNPFVRFRVVSFINDCKCAVPSLASLSAQASLASTIFVYRAGGWNFQCSARYKNRWYQSSTYDKKSILLLLVLLPSGFLNFSSRSSFVACIVWWWDDGKLRRGLSSWQIVWSNNEGNFWKWPGPSINVSNNSGVIPSSLFEDMAPLSHSLLLDPKQESRTIIDSGVDDDDDDDADTNNTGDAFDAAAVTTDSV